MKLSEYQKNYNIIHAIRYLQRLSATKKLLLKADAFGTLLLRLSLRDSQQSAPVTIKHLADKYSCIWASGLIFFWSVKRYLHRGFILYSDLELDIIHPSFLSARQCPEQWLQQNLLAFKEYFLIRYLHSFLVENSHQKTLPLTQFIFLLRSKRNWKQISYSHIQSY